MTVFRNDGRWDASNAVFDGRRVVRYDKREPDPAAAGMHHIDYGLSILRPRYGVEPHASPAGRATSPTCSTP